MFKIYFRTGLRNLIRHRSASLINLIGLTLGLSAIMVLSVLLYQYITANGQFKEKNRMYYVKSVTPDGRASSQTPFPFLYEAIKTSPQLAAGTHLLTWNRPWLKVGDKEFQESTYFVDPGFFRVFSFPLEAGNPVTALKEKNSIVLSHEMAEKLFGSIDPVGKTLTMDDSLPMTVTAVMQSIPSNTTFRPEVVLTTALLQDNKDFAAAADWYNTFSENYLLVEPGADTARLNAQLNAVAQAHYNPANKKVRLYLVPYTSFIKEEAGNIIQVMVKGEVAMIGFILLVMVANLLNLNAATLFSRHKEVAVKKMMGGTKKHILLQFCIENFILVAASVMLAFLLFQSVLLPYINTLVGTRFGNIVVNLRHDYPLALVFLLTGLLIVVVVGSYPAFHLNSLKVMDAIKGKSRNQGSYLTRNVFITLQFVLAITFIAITLILNGQIRHMKTATLGFDKDNVLAIPLGMAFKDPKAANARFDVLLNDLRNNPYVQGISTSDDYPTAYSYNYNNYFDPATGRELNFRHAYTDAGLLSTYKIPLIEGRDFVNGSEPAGMQEIIINKRAVEALGWKGPVVGRHLKARGGDGTYTVVGVMDDFHYQDLTRNVEPLMHHYGGRQQLGANCLSVRVDPRHSKEILAQLEAGFKAMPARRSFRYEYISDRIQQQYALLDGIGKATNYVALLTIFIASMGLFGLTALFTRQRVKEIGIRKVLGASPAGIVALLSRSFIFLVGIAVLIAAPLAWFVMDRWLRDFAYRISVQWWMLLGAGAIACTIALVTVGFHAIRAAIANPVDSLRSE
jgi:putative ABC transport system permease protein